MTSWNHKYSSNTEELRLRSLVLERVAQEQTISQIRALPLPENARVLEIGCGTGQHSAALAQLYPGWDITATDNSEDSVHEAGELMKVNTLSVQVQHADLLELPFHDSTFDLVFGDHVIAHVPDIDIALRECARVTKLGGYVVVNAANGLRPDGWRLYHALNPKPYLWRDFLPWQLQKKIRAAGYSVVRGYGSDLYLVRSIRSLLRKRGVSQTLTAKPVIAVASKSKLRAGLRAVRVCIEHCTPTWLPYKLRRGG